MKLNEKKIPDQEGEASTSIRRIARTNFQLKGVWLLLARGAWLAFVLPELVMLMLILLVSRVLPLKMVDKSINPLHTHFKPVFSP